MARTLKVIKRKKSKVNKNSKHIKTKKSRSECIWGKNKKLEKFWEKLALGKQVIIIYNNGETKKVSMPKTLEAIQNKYKVLENDDNIKVIITSAMSSDTYESLYKKAKNKSPDEVIKDYKKYLTSSRNNDKIWYLS